jgi:hypothetical protein
MRRAPFREISWWHSPLAAIFQQVQHRAEHLIQIHRARSGSFAHTLQRGTDLLEHLFYDDIWMTLSHLTRLAFLHDYE